MMLCLPSEVIFLSGIQTFISPYNKGHTYIISPFISGQWYVVKSVLDVNGGHTTAILTFFAFFTTPLHLMMWALVLLKCGNTCIPASFHCICILPLGRFLFKEGFLTIVNPNWIPMPIEIKLTNRKSLWNLHKIWHQWASVYQTLWQKETTSILLLQIFHTLIVIYHPILSM